MQYTFSILQTGFHSPVFKLKIPRFRGEYVLPRLFLMHYTGSSPAGEHRDRGRVEYSQDLTNVSPHPLPRAITTQSTRS